MDGIGFYAGDDKNRGEQIILFGWVTQASNYLTQMSVRSVKFCDTKGWEIWDGMNFIPHTTQDSGFRNHMEPGNMVQSKVEGPSKTDQPYIWESTVQ